MLRPLWYSIPIAVIPSEARQRSDIPRRSRYLSAGTEGRMRQHNYYVYIVANASRTIYVGVTNDLERRIWQHRHKTLGGFTARYDVSRLVWFELHVRVEDAIAREKEIKGWSRAKKLLLIETENPRGWDLSRDWEI